MVKFVDVEATESVSKVRANGGDGPKSFEKQTITPAKGSELSLFDSKNGPLSWSDLRDSGITPTNLSTLGGTEQSRAEFIRGAELLRLTGPSALPSAKIQPQQLLLADMLAACTAKNAVLLPRRSSKSTTLIAIGLGRAEARPDYRVGILTLTTGKAGRSRFLKDVVPALERVYRDKATAPFKISRSAGMESVTFHESGGSMSWLSTEADLRGEAFDLVILDEAAEASPSKVVDVVASALPTLDTRPGAQLVVAGTAGAYREGNLLHDWLVQGRAGHFGVIEYAAPDSTTNEEMQTWEPTEDNPAGHVRELVEACHPGLDGLTSIETIHGNFLALPVETFAREYLSVFGTVGTTAGVLDMVRWDEHGVTTSFPVPPAKFSLVMAVHRDQASAVIAAVWRDKAGVAHFGLIEHRKGVQWVAKRAVALARQYRLPIIHDTVGPVMVEVESISRERPKVRTLPQKYPDIRTAAAGLVKEVEGGKFRHYRQPALDEAVRLATKRTIGPTSWAFGAKMREHDTTAVEAIAMGLRVFDDGGARPGITMPAAMAA